MKLGAAPTGTAGGATGATGRDGAVVEVVGVATIRAGAVTTSSTLWEPGVPSLPRGSASLSLADNSRLNEARPDTEELRRMYRLMVRGVVHADEKPETADASLQRMPTGVV